MLIVGFLISCEEASSDSGSGSGEAAITATVLPRNPTTQNTAPTFIPDNYRTHFVTFSIRSVQADSGEYRLGLKLATATAPTATELINASAALTRGISTTPINIYLPFHIEGSYFDTGATQDATTATSTMLAANTQYSLYITPADGNGDVEKLIDITTDSPPPATVANILYGYPRPGVNYSSRSDDPFILSGYNRWGNGIQYVSQATDTEFMNGELGVEFASCPAQNYCLAITGYIHFGVGDRFFISTSMAYIANQSMLLRDNADNSRNIFTGTFVPQPAP